MIKNIINPNPLESINFINKFHTKKSDKTSLIIIGDCMIKYQGRAKSLLDWGQRIIILKQDYNILIHRPKMREPVNWLPSNSRINFFKEGGYLILDSYNKNPNEKLKIKFREVELIVVSDIQDNAKLTITGMEKDIVNQIIKNPEIIEKGLRITKREKHVKSGLIDLFGYDENHIPILIEVKRSIANISSVHQLRMYVSDIKKDIKTVKIRGILCAPKIPEMVKKLLNEYELEWREIERNLVLYDDFQKTLENYY